MKKVLFVAGCLFGMSAMAGEAAPAPTPVKPGTSVQNDTKQQQGQHQSSDSTAMAVGGGGGQGGAAINAGNNQYVVFNSPEEQTSHTNVHYSGSQKIHNVPSVGGPPLTSSNDTCMGSTSGSVNVAGFGGSYGTTWTDENCVMLKNSREMWNMGFRAAALARMCMDGMNREAFELTDLECPQAKKERETSQARTAVNANVEEPGLTDPIARRRLGYKPLQ